MDMGPKTNPNDALLETRKLRNWAWRYHTPNVARFLVENSDLSTYDKVTGLSYIDFVEVLGRIEAIIPVKDMSLKNIRALWYKIEEWKQRLDTYQGQTREFGPAFTYEALWHAHKEQGMSYTQIADELNLQISELFVADLEQLVSKSPTANTFTPFINVLEYYKLLEETHVAHRPGYLAIFLMERIGIKIDDAITWMNQALNNFRDGKRPFPPQSPITSEMVRERIREWNKKR